MGLSQAAILAEKMRTGSPNIKYFLLVGIAGGVPRYGPAGAITEIVLGEVSADVGCSTLKSGPSPDETLPSSQPRGPR